jgi:dolichol-phosphate mannosyltransferase
MHQYFTTMIHYAKTRILHVRLLKFAVVGLSGVIVNMGMLYLLTEYLGLLYIISSIIAIEISIISNFFLNDLWTWKDRVKKRFLERFFQYHISVGLTAILANWLILLILTEFFNIYYLISNLIGIAVGTFANFVVNDLWTFQKRTPDN